MATKRAAVSGSPQTKKARVSAVPDQVEEHVNDLVKAVGQVTSLPASCREMLTTLLPSALGAGAAKNERSAFQSEICASIMKVLEEVAKKMESDVANHASLVEAANADKAQKAACLTAAKEAVEACMADVKVKREALAGAKEDVSAANSKLAECEQEVDSCQKQKGKKEQARLKVNSLIEEHFNVLKAGDWESPAAQAKAEKKLMGPLISLVSKLKGDSSLRQALPAALGAKPQERGEFGNFTLDEVEKLLAVHLKEVDEWLSNFEPALAEKMNAVAQQKTELQYAEVVAATCDEFRQEAEAAHSRSKLAMKESKQVLAEYEQKAAEVVSEESQKESLLKEAKSNLAACVYLTDRVQADPEPEVPAVTEESKGDSELAA